MLQTDIQLIENLSEVDEEARRFLVDLQVKVYKFGLRKGLKFSQPTHTVAKCTKCGNETLLQFGINISVCSACITKLSDDAEANIPFELWLAMGKKKRRVSKLKGTSIPDCYRQLGVIAYKYGAKEFKEEGNFLWYETEDRKRKYYLRFNNAKVSNHSKRN